jgi:hypothetical protein
MSRTQGITKSGQIRDTEFSAAPGLKPGSLEALDAALKGRSSTEIPIRRGGALEHCEGWRCGRSQRPSCWRATA